MATAKEKEQAERLRNLRRELEEELEQQLLPLAENEKTRLEIQRIDESQPLEPLQCKRIIEALLFASTKPMSVAEIRKVLKFLTPKEIEEIILDLIREYSEQGRSFEIVQIAGGFEVATKKEYAPWILKVELQKKAKQVTQSALETLAILAYKQPITRMEIEDLRGVDVSGVMSTLLERGFVKIVGKKEVPGRPFLYGTTEKFLEHFGLKAVSDLPSLEEIKRIVESSVKKEDLIGTSKMVPLAGNEIQPAEPGKAQAAESDAPQASKTVETKDRGGFAATDPLATGEQAGLPAERRATQWRETRPYGEGEAENPLDSEGNGLESNPQQN